MTETDEFVVTKEIDASSEIRNGLLLFGEDVLSTKFPSFVDGFKDVTRRILWVTRDQRDSRAFAKLLGDIAETHVGGDSSIYEAIIRLGQEFMVGHPLIHVGGKVGTYYDPSGAAAPRYLKMAISEFSRDVFFNGINMRTIPMMATKNFAGAEPRYLIPKLPMALVMGNLTVGFGFKSTIPLIDFEDICNLVMVFSDYYQKGGMGIPPDKLFAKYLIPSFPMKNLVKNRETLLASYRQGDYSTPVSLEGWAEVSGNEIIIRAIPYGSDFGATTESIRDLMVDRRHWLWNYINSASQFSSDEAEFSLEVKRGQNPFEVLDKLKPLLRFNSRWHPLHNYMKDGRAVSLTPASLTYLWYQERMISITGSLKYKHADMIHRKLTLEALLQICDHTDDVIGIMKSAENEDNAVEQLHSKFEQLTWKQAKIISQQRFTTLVKANRRQLELDIEQIDVDIVNVVDSFTQVHEQIYADAQFLKKKYKSTRVSRISCDFMGYVQFGELGIIHFFTTDEMYTILNSKGWSSTVTKTIHLYDSKYPERFIIKGARLLPMGDPAKEITCEGVVCYPSNKTGYTLAIGEDQSTCILERAVTGIHGRFVVCNVTKTFYGVHRNGKITTENVANFTIRKTISKGAKSDLIYGLPDTSRDMIVIHMNTSDSNSLRIDRILHSNSLGSLKTVPTGEMNVLGIYPMGTPEIYVNIPEQCTKNTNMGHLVIKNIDAMFADNKNHYMISLTKSASNPFSRRFKRHDIVRTLFVLDLSE